MKLVYAVLAAALALGWTAKAEAAGACSVVCKGCELCELPCNAGTKNHPEPRTCGTTGECSKQCSHTAASTGLELLLAGVAAPREVCTADDGAPACDQGASGADATPAASAASRGPMNGSSTK